MEDTARREPYLPIGLTVFQKFAKRCAREFRNINNYTNMIYFLCSKLNFSYPRHFT
jgi:hypothetical protein